MNPIEIRDKDTIDRSCVGRPQIDGEPEHFLERMKRIPDEPDHAPIMPSIQAVPSVGALGKAIGGRWRDAN